MVRLVICNNLKVSSLSEANVCKIMFEITQLLPEDERINFSCLFTLHMNVSRYSVKNNTFTDMIKSAQALADKPTRLESSCLRSIRMIPH
jgi:hypothetical protein